MGIRDTRETIRTILTPRMAVRAGLEPAQRDRVDAAVTVWAMATAEPGGQGRASGMVAKVAMAQVRAMVATAVREAPMEGMAGTEVWVASLVATVGMVETRRTESEATEETEGLVLPLMATVETAVLVVPGRSGATVVPVGQGQATATVAEGVTVAPGRMPLAGMAAAAGVQQEDRGAMVGMAETAEDLVATAATAGVHLAVPVAMAATAETATRMATAGAEGTAAQAAAAHPLAATGTVVRLSA